MATLGLIWFVVGTVLFSIVLLLVQAESKRGKRFFLADVRRWLDTKIAALGRKVVGAWEHFTKYVVQLGWYYGIHSFLRAVLATLVAFYERVERIFESNRRRTRELRAEKTQMSDGAPNHLTEMARHKADTALTPAQQHRLKASQLEGD